MHTDDLNFFQRHAEKLALGLGLLVLLFVVATQFLLGEPNAAELNNQSVAPGEVEQVVQTQANQLRNQLAAGTEVQPIEIPPYDESFVKLYQLDVAPDESFAAMQGWPYLGKIIKTGIEYSPLYLPQPPVPSELLVKSGNGVLPQRAEDVEQIPLRQIIGDRNPADFPYASVSANFDYLQWKLRLEGAEQDRGLRIPPSLWKQRLALTSVYLLRQEWDPKTNQWTPQQGKLIEPLPGQFAVLPTMQDELSIEQAAQLTDSIRQSQPRIARPLFPEISNAVWTPPDVSNRVFTDEENERLRDLDKSIQNLEVRLNRMTGGGQIVDNANPREQAQLDRLQGELAEKVGERNRMLGIDDADLGGGLSGGLDEEAFEDGGEEFPRPRDFGQPGGPRDFGRPPPGRGGFNNPEGDAPQAEGDVPDQVKVWAHDLTVEYGKTYRYKLVVTVFNPLFRQSRLPEQQRLENYHKVSLGPTQEEIDSVPWSSEITIDPKYFFFVVGGNIDEKRARVETWTIFNGVWRTSEFQESPGNEIGGFADIDGVAVAGGRGVPMNVGRILLDVDSVSGGGPGGNRAVVRALYLDPADGTIRSRLVDDDRKSNKRQELSNEKRIQEERAAQLSAGN